MGTMAEKRRSSCGPFTCSRLWTKSSIQEHGSWFSLELGLGCEINPRKGSDLGRGPGPGCGPLSKSQSMVWAKDLAGGSTELRDTLVGSMSKGPSLNIRYHTSVRICTKMGLRADGQSLSKTQCLCEICYM